MPKRYMVANQLRSALPHEFITSRDDRHISVINVKLMKISTGNLLMDVSCHGDFIVDNADRNGFMCFCNEQLAMRKKWEIFHKPDFITFHFEDMDGNIVDPSDLKFTVELLLSY